MNKECDPQSASIDIGSLWIKAAADLLIAAPQGCGPWAVTMNRDGLLRAVNRGHPDYEKSLLSPNFVSVLLPTTEVEVLAWRLREAAERCAVQ